MEWHAELFVEVLMCLWGVLFHLSQTNLKELLSTPGFFCGREAELDFPESQEQVCSVLDRSKWSCSLLESRQNLGTAPQDKAACPSYSRRWMAGSLVKTAVWELWAWIHSHLHRFVLVQRDIFLAEMWQTWHCFGAACPSAGRGWLQFSGSLKLQLWCAKPFPFC